MSKWNTTSTLSLYLTLICSSAVASFLKYSLEDSFTGLSDLPGIVDIGIYAALMTALYYFFAQLFNWLYSEVQKNDDGNSTEDNKLGR
ncbi:MULTISPECIES: hypothetical protein [Shewanella]|uniref:Uncharacterized protein n=1 Tax=Shewanella psychromarinicola TaxID=2487742 RepID=A0A3N4E2A0_9GAMM|nr:hypothetical protein [Shewanella psychromarinicola]AZG34186.1 hypothetical protein EGC80_04115 [Shewanella psychromarinicola]MCL1081843.1 hypothetical protein [Shewanella psychromarinicola]RPA32279.1 hypothetical protein EGC77_10710 [Shewanella psychromarinicola]